MTLDDKVLAVIRKEGKGIGGVDEWFIASSIYPWDGHDMRRKRGAWIRAVIGACCRLQERGLVGTFTVSHGEGTVGTRIWGARSWSNYG